MRPLILQPIWRLAVLGGPGVAAYIVVIQPWHRRWGATAQEARRTLPGDELVPNPAMSATHAITIATRAADVWPWLGQLGQDRGGLYSYASLETLLGCRMRNTGRVIPELQHLQVGDVVRLGPEPYPAYAVRLIERRRALVLRTADPRSGRAVEPAEVASGAWVVVLDQPDEQTARLVVRSRNDWKPSPASFLWGRILSEPAHFVMERKMLKTIKRLAEQP